MAKHVLDTVPKFAGEHRLPTFDFSNMPEFAQRSLTIVGSPTFTVVSGDGALVIGSFVVDGPLVYIQISGGTVGVQYIVKCQIDLSDSFSKLEGYGIVRIDSVT